jgi:hypothetical protein
MEPSTVDELMSDISSYLNQNRDSLPAENQQLLERSLDILEGVQDGPPPGGARRQLLEMLSIWFLRECAMPELLDFLEQAMDRIEDVL